VTLLLKLLLAPALVVGSSLAGRRWGARMTGVLVGLPIVAGPILLIACLDHGTRFGAAAASSALLGLLTLALFAVVFAWCARRLGWLASLGVSWSACLIADLALARLTVPPVVGFVLVLAAMWAAARAMPPDAGAWDSRPVVAPRRPSASRRPQPSSSSWPGSGCSDAAPTGTAERSAGDGDTVRSVLATAGASRRRRERGGAAAHRSSGHGIGH
jgi:hypothetical protein